MNRAFRRGCVLPSRVAPAAVIILLGHFGAAATGAATHHAHDELGVVDLPVSCSEPAQVEFNRALALLHHMTYPEARSAFRQVAKLDPRCAMAYWGVAMTLFQPLWPTRPGPQALREGWDAVETARTLEPPSERERLYVESVAAFFQEPSSSDYWARIGRWEQATKKLHEAHPDDPEAAVFYALAHLATTPADSVTRAHADRAAAILLGVYGRNPDHPGAMHYLLHANDVPGRERESLEITRRYETLAPRNPHALHMPTHIHTRLGNWDAVIQGNLRAADAALEHPAGDQGQYVWDEFPHAIEYLIYAYLQEGRDEQAAAQLQRLLATDRLEPSFKTAFHLASTQSRYALERRAWTEALALAPPEHGALDWNRYPWPAAILESARGLGAARLEQLEVSRAAVVRLAELEASARAAGETLFARNILILRLELDAWVAHIEGRRDAALVLAREATALEDTTPKHAVTPGPILPAHEQLGDMQMEQAHPEDALQSYQRSMDLYPGRLNSVLGAARAAHAAGDASLARSYYQTLLKLCGKGTRLLPRQEAQAYLSATAP